MKINKPRVALAGFVFLPFVVAAVLGGCASTSNEIAPDSLSCTQLAAEIDGTRIARVQAVEKQQDPWKFVIPFAVAGRHVASEASVADADRWLAELSQAAERKGCGQQAKAGRAGRA